MPNISPLSMLFNHLSMRFIKAVLHEYFSLKPDFDLCMISYLFMQANKCFVMCFSMILERTDSIEIGR